MAFTLKFGKHKGKDVSEVDENYLTFMLTLDNLYPETKAEIEKELARRRGGDGPKTGHGKPGTAGSNAEIYNRALDIVAVGGAALAGRPYTEQAVAWLKDATAGGPAPDGEVPF